MKTLFVLFSLFSVSSFAAISCKDNGEEVYQCTMVDEDDGEVEIAICKYGARYAMASYTNNTHTYSLEHLITRHDDSKELVLGYAVDANDPETIIGTLTMNKETKKGVLRSDILREIPETVVDCSK